MRAVHQVTIVIYLIASSPRRDDRDRLLQRGRVV